MWLYFSTVTKWYAHYLLNLLTNAYKHIHSYARELTHIHTSKLFLYTMSIKDMLVNVYCSFPIGLENYGKVHPRYIIITAYNNNQEPYILATRKVMLTSLTFRVMASPTDQMYTPATACDACT